MKNFIYGLSRYYQNLGKSLQHIDGIAALAIRLYLVPIFWMAGTNKLMHFNDIVEWFGSSDGGLGLPFPYLMAVLATSTELAGAILFNIRFIYPFN